MLQKLSFLYFIFLPVYLYSQQKTDSAFIKFNSETYDFGSIYEADGNAYVYFEVKNVGKSSLKISKIYSPGLTLEGWTKDSIQTDSSAIITFRISPFGQPGHFEKAIHIFSNAANSPSELAVKGKIIAGSFKNEFKHRIGPVFFKQSQLNFGYIYKGEEVVRFAPILNKSDKPVSIKFDSVPPFLSVIPKFDTLYPGENAMIEVRFNTIECNDWDFFLQKIEVVILSTDTILGLITITANIREDFSILTEEDKLNKPLVSIPVKVFNFDTISSGEKVYYNFLLQNNGSRDLNIRAVKPTCGCTAAMPEKTIIAPGDSAHIRVEFNSEGFAGLNKKGVTVITDDPINYKQFLWITGVVE
jgi:hypothetical protein